MNNQVNLHGKVVVITGASGVLGSEMSKVIARNGAKVALLSLDQEELTALETEINITGGQALAIKTNVLDIEQLKAAKKQINIHFGQVDILINGAGGNHPKGTTTKDFLEVEDMNDDSLQTFYDLDLDSIRFVLDLNYLGTLLPSQVFTKDMINRQGTSIINISSMNAFTPLTRIPAYSGAKAAVSNFTQWLAVHFSKVGIRVNAIAPGFFSTAQNKKLLYNDDGTLSERAKKIINQTPMGRFGQPEELLGTLLWLLDDQWSGFVNGVVIPVDGGFSAYSGV